MSKIINRPKRITIIAWISIILSLLSATPKFLLAINSEVYQQAKEILEAASKNALFNIPIELQIVHALLGSVVLITSALFMLRGRIWALYLYTFWIYTVVLMTLLVSGPSPQFISKTVFAFILCGLLFSPKSMLFFKGNNE